MLLEAPMAVAAPRLVLEGLLAQASGQQSNPMVTFGFLGLMVVIFYFFLIRPQSKQVKEHKTMLAALKKGDVVVTNGGVIGKVHTVADKFILVEVAPSVRLRILASASSSKAPAGLVPDDEEDDFKDKK